MKTIKQIGYKLIVVLCIVSSLWCFIGSCPVNAASKVKTEDFYYSGTVKGSYTVNKGFFSKLVEALEGILDYILGIMTMAIRMPFIGWTELLEKMLTWLMESATGMEIDVEGVDATGIIDPDDYITLDAIIFNKIPLLDINVFESEVDSTHDALGHEVPPDEQTVASDDSLIMIIKHTIAGWYYTFRTISIMIMLILLIYIGIKLATTTIATDKAVYKKMLTDWLVGMILVFSIHYIILIMINFNEILVDEISKMKLGYNNMKVYEYGLEERATKGVTDEELEESIYDEVRTRAYDAKYTVGTTGMIMYMILVYYAWKFTFIYLKRYLVVAVLIMMAPVVAISYAYNKVRSGKAVIFSNWMKELFFLIMLQSIHALMYVVFFETALAISLESIGGIILAFIMIHFMSKAEEIFRKIFGVKGSLTDSTDKGKLKDIKTFVNSAVLGVGASKVAAGMTKKAAGVITKPARAAGNFALGKVMARRANKLSNLVNGSKDGEELNDNEQEEIDDLTRRNKMELGAFAKNLKNGVYDGDKAKLEKALKEVMERVPISNDEGALSEEEYLAQIQENQDNYALEYDKLKKGVGKYNRQKRWKEITDPFQYVQYDKEKGKYVRIKNKREHENWGPILKYMSKKTDGTGVTFSKYMNTTYLLGINDRTKKEWKKQAAILKDGVLGFFGILVGLPLVVAEPAVGMAFMAKGISSAGKVLTGDGRRRMRNLNGIVMDEDGKYRLVRYEGKSLETIKDGMQASARETFENIEADREKHNKEVVRRTKKHKKVYDRLMGYARLGGIGAGVTGGVAGTLNTVRSASFTPMAVGTVAGVALGAKLTGHILGNMSANAYMAWHDTVRAERKAATKEWEKEWSSTDTALDFMAEKYYEAEMQSQDAKVDQTTTKFEDAYVMLSAVTDKIDAIEDDATLLRETSYDEEIVVEEKEDGKKKLALDTETKIIDNAIIETVQKCGIIDITECDIKQGNRIAQVNKAITDVLIQKGVIDKTQKADDIIENLDKRIEERKIKLDSERPNAVEEKMTDDAIIATMQIQNVTDPNVVQVGDVMEAFSKKYEKMVDVPTEQSASAVDALEKQKATQLQPQKTTEAQMEAVKERVQSSIQARKTILSDKSKQKLDDTTKKKLKEELKRKKTLELDVMVLSAQDQIEETINATNGNSTNNDNAIFTKENIEEFGFDFVTKDNQDEVIKMLQLQTELHKSKKELSEVRAHTTEKTKKRVMSYKADSGLIDLDGSVRVNQYKDGSRRVVDRKPLSDAATQSIEDVLKKVKSNV